MTSEDEHAAVVAAVSPSSVEELADFLATATHEQTAVAVVGGGTHRDVGHRPAVDTEVFTRGLSGIVEWQPDDLTVVVRAGTRVAELERELATGGQTAVLPETGGEATVGGVVAAAVSAYRRLRYGPTRDRMLEVSAVTGDGRAIKGGGRVVKNVTGYDLPRLYTGSLGSLGIITSVCLKLWPLTEATATVFAAELPAPTTLHRPMAVLETGEGVRVMLAGTRAEVQDQAHRLGGTSQPGLSYPEPLAGPVVWSLRVRPRLLPDAVGRLPPTRFVAQHGVGEVSFQASADFDVSDIRGWAEGSGGRLVRLRGDTDADPWGTPPPGLELQRRVVAAFDPGRILEPGRLPGRI